ncbi:primase small subunit [Seminavis robusta]|uniref:DNA primase n=1 Tax=Seminavis robusta TaxID=568900 RepID=A0A9N8D494_9STRA|nr:primase small subunit [Seminavis robusta]|eukprot:Sro1_g000510.1 primase small subunit (507) ;mRNA; f:153642-155267
MPEESTQEQDPDNGTTAVAATSPTSAVTNVYAKDNSNKEITNEDFDMDEDEPMQTETEAAKKSTAVVFSPELLKMYYARLFPFDLLHSWLAYSPNNNNSQSWLFSRREFSMTIEPSPGEEIYIRYQSFSTSQELTTAILKRRPTKIDLGAIFSQAPKDHKTLQKGQLQPVQRELVFDIDLTDYDDIRHCGCTGAQICNKCWVFMTMAVEVLDGGLKKDFGFDHVSWFYSGRRGIHAWICDETARTLTNEARNAVATYFEVKLASDNNKDVELHLPLHPSLQRAFDILEPWFISDILPASGHGLLASPERWKKDLLDTIPEAGKSIASLLEKKWANDTTTPAEKWEQLKKHVRVLIGQGGGAKTKTAKTMSTKDKLRLEHWPIEVVFRHTYPRLDINVSKTMNHLLKSPFCVHPKTGRVCVPIQPEEIRQFDPFAVPTLGRLMEELDDYEKTAAMEERPKPKHEWQKTSLKGYFEPFQKAFLEPLHKEIRKHDKNQAEQAAAMRGDF